MRSFEGVSAGAVNVLRLIRTQILQGSLIDLHPAGHERLQRFRHRHYIVKMRFATRWWYRDHLAFFIARVFARRRPPPNATYCTNRLNDSLLFVAV
jgi:hypothetical protein